ncbi:MAG TPA: lipopolysaccharide biosynthesis protein [Aestuariivirgaceae bacterium]
MSAVLKQYAMWLLSPRKKTDALAQSIISGGLAALLIKVGTAGLSYLMFVVFARHMSSDDFGRFSFGFSLAIALAAFAAGGLSTAVLRFWPEYQVSGRSRLGSSFVRWGWWGTFGGALATAVGVMAVSLFFGKRTSGDTIYHAAIVLLMAAIALSEFGASALRADGRTVIALAPRDIIWRIALVSALALLGMAHVKLDAVEGLFLAGTLLVVIAAVQSIWSIGMARTDTKESVPPEIRSGWLKALWPMWGGGVLFAMVQQFDVVVVGLFLTPEETGSYFAALRTAGLLGLTLIAGSMVGAPLFARYYHAGNTTELTRLCRVLSVCIAVPTLLGFLFLLFAGRWLLGMFDEGFVHAYDLLLILAVGLGFDAICGPTAIFLQMIGRERDYLKTTALCYAATLVTQCVLTPVLGPIGAAVPNALGLIGWNIWALRLLRSELGLDCSIFGLCWKRLPTKTAERHA